MSTPSTSSPAREKCRLAEVLQYKCTLEQEADGRPTVRCLPVPRIFRMCIHSHPRVPNEVLTLHVQAAPTGLQSR